MRRLKDLWVWGVCGIYILILAQVTWWAWVFTQSADRVAELQIQILGSHPATPEVNRIYREAFHKKLMFLSESAFFALLTGIGLAILYRSLRREQKSRESQRNFIEILSHESKTPLTSLKLRLEALHENTASGSTLAQNLGEALEEIRRLASGFEKTMDLNRTERKALHFEPIALNEITDSVIRRLRPWLSSKGAHLVLETSEDIYVHGDFASLQGSFQSLVENAVLYNPAARKNVKVRIESRGTRAVLIVHDDGPGIEEHEGARVFDRFYRGQRHPSVSGTGLGLYLAKVIVEAHQGVLRLVREVKSGACFEIDLPRREMA